MRLKKQILKISQITICSFCSFTKLDRFRTLNLNYQNGLAFVYHLFDPFRDKSDTLASEIRWSLFYSSVNVGQVAGDGLRHHLGTKKRNFSKLVFGTKKNFVLSSVGYLFETSDWKNQWIPLCRVRTRKVLLYKVVLRSAVGNSFCLATT